MNSSTRQTDAKMNTQELQRILDRPGIFITTVQRFMSLNWAGYGVRDPATMRSNLYPQFSQTAVMSEAEVPYSVGNSKNSPIINIMQVAFNAIDKNGDGVVTREVCRIRFFAFAAHETAPDRNSEERTNRTVVPHRVSKWLRPRSRWPRQEPARRERDWRCGALLLTL